MTLGAQPPAPDPGLGLQGSVGSVTGRHQGQVSPGQSQWSASIRPQLPITLLPLPTLDSC